MRASLSSPHREERPLSVLIVGGSHKLYQIALQHEASRTDGHVLLLATCIKAAWEILSTNTVDRIIIEAFMENSEHESPFQFLHLLKDSAYSHIAVMLIAAEPSAIGTSLAPLVSRTAHCFGAEFQLVSEFIPELIRVKTSELGQAKKMVQDV